MEPHERLRVLLEIDRSAGDSISGRIGVNGDLREFSGWLTLISVVECARRAETAVGRSPPGIAVVMPAHAAPTQSTNPSGGTP